MPAEKDSKTQEATEAENADDTLGILSISEYSNTPPLLRVVLTKAGAAEFVADPTIASVYWKWLPAFRPGAILMRFVHILRSAARRGRHPIGCRP